MIPRTCGNGFLLMLQIKILEECAQTLLSYGKLESLNLIIPRFMGGGSSDLIDRDSDFVKEIRKYDNESANIIYRNACCLSDF